MGYPPGPRRPAPPTTRPERIPPVQHDNYRVSASLSKQSRARPGLRAYGLTPNG